jgi:hypothetical protein
MEHVAGFGIVELVGLAASVSLLSGWRLYLVVLATGLAMRTGWVPLPEHLESLQVLGSPWVLGVAAAGAVGEFLVDKFAFFDSAWDAVHTVLRPVGGALLALAVVDPSDPAVQVIAVLLGAGGALLSHGGKAGVRALVNTSPEPVSNVVVSTTEDIAAGSLVVLAFAAPLVAAVLALLMAAGAIYLMLAARRTLRRMLSRPVQPRIRRR